MSETEPVTSPIRLQRKQASGSGFLWSSLLIDNANITEVDSSRDLQGLAAVRFKRNLTELAEPYRGNSQAVNDSTDAIAHSDGGVRVLL